MNEVGLIRAQLSLERQHALEVGRALAAANSSGGETNVPDGFRQASVEYLVWILSRFEEREQVFHDLLRARFAADDTNRRTVEAALALPGTSREALAKLETALATDSNTLQPQRWIDFVNFFTGPWSIRRDELDRLFGSQAKVTDWRTVAAIDADSIFDERRRHSRVSAGHPMLQPPPGASRA